MTKDVFQYTCQELGHRGLVQGDGGPSSAPRGPEEVQKKALRPVGVSGSVLRIVLLQTKRMISDSIVGLPWAHASSHEP